MKGSISYVSGKIDTRQGKCFVGSQEVECPKSGNEGRTSAGTYKLDLLPPNQSLEIRNDLIYTVILLVVVVSFLLLLVLKVKIFGKTLIEYLTPIWYFVLISLLAVAWQYLYGVKMADNLLALRISQWVWEGAVLVSVWKLSRVPDFSYANMFFLGIVYSLIIHGTKVTVRYFFFGSTFWYMLDRFLYGSLLVMLVAFVLGSVFVYLKRRGG